MLDRKFILENAALVTQNCLNRGVAVDVRVSSRWKTTARPRKPRSTSSINRPTKSPSRSAARRILPERERARKKAERCGDRTAALQAELDATSALVRDPSLDSEYDPSRRSGRKGRRGQPRVVSRTDAAAPIRLRAAGPRAVGRAARSDRSGGGRPGDRPWIYFLKNEAVLLELALQRYALDVLLAEGFTPMITPTWPAIRCSKASASSRVVRKRKFTALKIAT